MADQRCSGDVTASCLGDKTAIIRALTLSATSWWGRVGLIARNVGGDLGVYVKRPWSTGGRCLGLPVMYCSGIRCSCPLHASAVPGTGSCHTCQWNDRHEFSRASHLFSHCVVCVPLWFSNRVIDNWNSLPALCVNSATINSFKKHVSIPLEPETV